MELLFLLLLTIVNGILAMAETAIISARKARLEQAAAQGDPRARVTLEMANDPNRFLSTTQIGITLVGIFTGAFGGVTVAENLGVQLAQVPALEPYALTISITLVVALTTYLSLVIGELVPKRLALINPERVALTLVPALSSSRTGAEFVFPPDRAAGTFTRFINRCRPASHGDPQLGRAARHPG